MNDRTLGVAIVGLGGAVGTTMVAGVELIKQGLVRNDGLPLASVRNDDLVGYGDIVFAGWDVFPDHLAKAAEQHDVLTHKQFAAVESSLRAIKPWPAISNPQFLSNIDGTNTLDAGSHRDVIEKLRSDLAAYRKTVDSTVVINLASTEKLAAEGNEAFNSLSDFERALEENSSDVSPAM